MIANAQQPDFPGQSSFEAEVLFRQIAESIQEIFWMTDPVKSHTLYISPAYEKIWGRTVESLYRHPTSFVDAIHEEDRARVIAALPRQLTGEYEEEYRIVRPDGTVRWIRDKAFPIRNEKGEVYRVTGVATDITENKRAQDEVIRLNRELERGIAERTDELVQANLRLSAEINQHRRTEAALRESRNRLSGVIVKAHEAVVLMNTQGVVEEWNPQAEQIFGWPRNEAVGRKIADLIVPHRYRAAHERGIERYLQTGQGTILNRRLELPALHRDGHEFSIELSVWPVQSSDSTVFGAFIRDISERKEEEQALQARTARTLRFRDALYALSRLNKTDFNLALEKILEADATTLGVERVSYWSLAEGSQKSERAMTYLLSQASVVSDAGGLTFDAVGYPNYFAALASHTPVVAHRAQEDPATSEFTETYLRPHGITSMLDVGVWFQGRMVGVICHAHAGEPREWQPEEVEFAASIASMISLALEASNRHALTTALFESEEKYRLVVEHANEAIIVAQDGFVRFANPSAVAMSGYSAEEYYRTPFLEMIHPEDRARIVENYRRRVTGQPAENEYEFRIVTKQGKTTWLLISAVVIQWQGRPATLNFLTDITERQRLQEDLKHTLAEREAILQTSVVGIVFTRDRRIRWINRALEQHMLGYEPGELVGMDTEVCYATREEYERLGEQAYSTIARGATWECEMQLKRKDGSLFWCQETGRAMDPKDLSQGAIWIMTDITRRREAEENLRKALEQERELSELKSRFVSMTSHEFRTPLATILSATELLEKYSDRLPASEKQELISLTKSAVNRMTVMLEEVLLIGKAEAGHVEFHPQPINIRVLAATLIEEVKRAAESTCHVDFSTQGEVLEPLLDEKLIRHILTNLLSNAIKYSPASAPVRFHLRCDREEAVFEVSDKGIGIPREDQPRLFTTFHRGRNVSNVSGTGLGLAIVKKCVELHGGTVSFTSEVGRGTTFVVRIPPVREHRHA